MVLKLQINGRDMLKEKDKWGKPIDYQICKHLKSGKSFLNIWSKGRYILGTYDIWNSKCGDILTLKFSNSSQDEDELNFEFSNGRYWLINDSLKEQEIKDAFIEMNPEVQSVEMGDGYLDAIFPSYEARYKYYADNGNLQFEEVSLTLYDDFEDAGEQTEEGIIKCDNDCHYQEEGVCKYFDWQMEESSNVKPFCNEPFTYLEQRAKQDDF